MTSNVTKLECLALNHKNRNLYLSVLCAKVIIFHSQSKSHLSLMSTLMNLKNKR